MTDNTSDTENSNASNDRDSTKDMDRVNGVTFGIHGPAGVEIPDPITAAEICESLHGVLEMLVARYGQEQAEDRLDAAVNAMVAILNHRLWTLSPHGYPLPGISTSMARMFTPPYGHRVDVLTYEIRRMASQLDADLISHRTRPRRFAATTRDLRRQLHHLEGALFALHIMSTNGYVKAVGWESATGAEAMGINLQDLQARTP